MPIKDVYLVLMSVSSIATLGILLQIVRLQLRRRKAQAR